MEVILMAGFWAGVVLLAMATASTPTAGLLASCIATLILFPIVSRVARGTLNLFEPITLSSAASFVMYVGRPIGDQVRGAYLHLGYDIRGTFEWTLFTVLAGVATFTFGYHVGRTVPLRRLFPTPPSLFPERTLVLGAMTMAVLGVTLFGSFLAENGGPRAIAIILGGRGLRYTLMLHRSSAYLYFGIYLLLPADLIFFGLWKRVGAIRYLMLAFVTGGLLFVYEVSVGNRSEMLPLVFGLATVHYLWRGHGPRPGMVIAAGLLLLLSFALLREVRNATSSVRRDVQSADALRRPVAALSTVFNGDDSEMFDTFCSVVEVVPDRIPYHPFGFFTDLGVRAIPRTLFPRKHMEITDQVVATLWPAHFRISRASAASSILANFYMWGGIAGVAVCSLLMGVFMRSVWEWYLSHSNNLNAILLYAFVPALVVILWRGTVTDTLGRMFFTALPMFLLQSYIRGSRCLRYGGRGSGNRTAPQPTRRTGREQGMKRIQVVIAVSMLAGAGAVLGQVPVLAQPDQDAVSLPVQSQPDSNRRPDVHRDARAWTTYDPAIKEFVMAVPLPARTDSDQLATLRKSCDSSGAFSTASRTVHPKAASSWIAGTNTFRSGLPLKAETDRTPDRQQHSTSQMPVTLQERQGPSFHLGRESSDQPPKPPTISGDPPGRMPRVEEAREPPSASVVNSTALGLTFGRASIPLIDWSTAEARRSTGAAASRANRSGYSYRRTRSLRLKPSFIACDARRDQSPGAADEHAILPR